MPYHKKRRTDRPVRGLTPPEVMTVSKAKKSKGKSSIVVPCSRPRPKASAKFEDVSDSSSVKTDELCNDSSDDDCDIDSMLIDRGPKPVKCNRSDDKPMNYDDVCIICGEFGKNNEIWFRCTLFGNWVHGDCSGATKPRGYVCDYCK